MTVTVWARVLMATLVAAYFSRFYFYTLLIRFIFNYYYCFVVSTGLGNILKSLLWSEDAICRDLFQLGLTNIVRLY